MKKIVSIVTICALVVSIGAFSVFGANVIDSSRLTTSDTTFYTGDDGSVHIFTQCYSIDPYIDNIVSTPTTTSTGTYYDISFNAVQEYVIAIRLYNTTDDIYKFNRGLVGVYPQRPAASNIGSYTFDGTGYELKEIQGDIFGNISIQTNGNILCYGSYEWLHGNMITLPPKCSIYAFFSVLSIDKYHVSSAIGDYINMSPSSFDRPVSSITVVYPESASINNDAYLYNVNYNSYLTEENAREIYQSMITANSKLNSIDSSISNIESNVQSILDQYTANSQNAQSVTNGTQTNDQTISNIATNEDTWFTQNDQALTATGIDDFTYTPSVMSGLTVISDQFNQLWNAIGDWNFVYTFSMMIGLVVLILRHNPQRKNSSSGGKSNASGS